MSVRLHLAYACIATAYAVKLEDQILAEVGTTFELDIEGLVGAGVGMVGAAASGDLEGAADLAIGAGSDVAGDAVGAGLEAAGLPEGASDMMGNVAGGIVDNSVTSAVGLPSMTEE